ncbi:hypothetical protein [uncultured Clostridium sp.]|nr:hypothetical protein [uncultured Clostridium sp.]
MTYVIVSNKNIKLPHTILGSINFGAENIKKMIEHYSSFKIKNG